MRQTKPDILPTKGPRAHRPVRIGNTVFGAGSVSVIAGPCSVESLAQIASVASSVAELGAVALRGGAFKPRTSPDAFAGLGRAALPMLEAAKRNTGLPVVTEVMDIDDIDAIVASADCLQIGARNMQNFSLLHAVGATQTPVLLKRGFGCTVEELLRAADHIRSRGNEDIILCERGIRSFTDHGRFTLDIAAIAWLKQHASYPVVADPSHAAGRASLVTPLALAAVAAGADGLLVEVHDVPANALSDAEQALDIPQFSSLMSQLQAMCGALGKPLGTASVAVRGVA
jgi:3-deoxy-7-phosphoheptulonate synthase